MKNDRWVYYKDVKPQDMGGGVTRRVLAYSDDLIVKNVVRKGDTMLKTNDVIHGCVCLEAGVLLDIFNPYRKDFVED